MADEQQIPEQQDGEAPQAPPTPPPPPPGGDGELQRLYNGLHDEGSYTKSYDEFKKKYSTPDQIDQLYKGLHDEGSFTKTKEDFYAKYFPTASEPPVPKLKVSDYLKPQAPAPTESTGAPVAAIKRREDLDQSQDPLIVARRKQYDTMRTQALQDVESDAWKDKVFTGKIPALTEDQNMPVQAFQKIDTKGLESYLDTQHLDPRDRYWMRNQIINYANERQAQYYINQRTQKNIQAIPEVKTAQDAAYQKMIKGEITPEQYDATWKAEIAKKPDLQPAVELAFNHAAAQYRAHQAEAIANKLNNVGLNDQPIDQNAPFHDQITGANKTLMGALTYAGDIEGQLSSFLDLGHIPALSNLGYKLKTEADDSNAKNALPRNGEMGNFLAGEVLPMALDMETLRRLSVAAGRPIYQSLAKARATGTLGQFAEGALGGLAISPANSYIISHQYYNDLVKQGMNPGDAGSKADQLLVKNMATDMLMTPLQMGLMKMPTGNVMKKALTLGAEGLTSGVHFSLQDFNQQSTENPAMHILDYVQSDGAKKSFLMGAVLGTLQKAAVDKLHSWDINSKTNDMFQFNRKYGADQQPDLPSNQSIASNVLSAIELRDTPKRVQELKDLTGSLQESGVYTPQEASRINSIIDDVDVVRKAVPKYGTPQQKLAVMNELLTQRGLEQFINMSGNESAAKPIELMKKQSEKRIEDIMSGKEPLYFVNGNETTKEQLLEAAEKDPSLLSAKGLKIDIHNDEETQQKLFDLKTSHDAIQKQSPAETDVRAASGDRSKVGQGDESKGTVDQGAPGKEGGDEDTNVVKQFKSKVKQFLEARHGDTENDEAKKVSGQDNDKLSEKGRADAARLAEEVATHHSISKVISSDLQRAVETAQIVAGKTGAVHETRPELRSWDLGELRGMDDADFKKAQEHLVANPDTHEYEGKTLGESFNEYKDRVIEAQKKLLGEGPDTMVINHSNNMAVWDAYEKNGMAWSDQAAKDYLQDKLVEPAQIKERAVDDIAPDIKSGAITPDEVYGAVKNAVDDIIPSGDHGIAEDIESGEIPEKTLLDTFKQAIDEAKQSIQRVREGGGIEAGGREPDETPGREPAEGGDEKGVPQPGKDEGTKTDGEDTGAEPVSGDTGTADEPGAVVQKAGIPLVEEFVEHDVKPKLLAIADNLKDGFDLLRRTFDPRYGVSEKALSSIMKALGDRNQMENLVDALLKDMEKMFDKMKPRDRIDFIDALKRGQLPNTQLTPYAPLKIPGKKIQSSNLNHIADMLRKMDKALYDEITKYNPSLPWKENHFRVLWKVIPGSKPGAKEKIWSMVSRRPFQGSRGFMKRATLADMSEGIAKGGEPVSTNPITMFKLAYADGMKYITAQRMFEGLKKDGFVKYVKTGQQPPDGFVRLDDNLTKVYFKVPEGLVSAGEYYINEGAGRLLNNHLSRDYIREAKIGRGLMALKNTYTAAELGLSGFHAVAEGLEAFGSQIGIGLRKMFNLGIARRDLGAFGSGVKDILTSPTAAWTTASTGKKAMQFATSEEFRQSPEGMNFLRRFPGAAQYVDDFFKGGGLMKQPEDLMAKTKQAWQEQAAKNNFIGAALRLLPAFNEHLMGPLFNTYIPRLKVGMFFKEFPVRLAENQARLDKGQVTRAELARKTIDDVDNRLGEMNFDNLFWNRTFKTAQQFFLRSVTWKLGNLRQMGGIIPEQAREIYSAAKEGRAPMLMPKAAWLLGLTTMQVILSQITQKMLADKDLSSFKDIVAPQIDPEDATQRVIMPTYYKDLLHMQHDPLGYTTSSMSGQLSKVHDVWNNKDFYGYEIYDSHAPIDEKAKQIGSYLIPKPFSITSAVAMSDKGEPLSKQLMSFAGLVKAPGYLEHTDMENKIFDLYNIRNTGSKPFKEREAGVAKSEIRSLYREGKLKDAQDLLQKSVKEGLIRPTQVKSLLQHAKGSDNPSVYFFKQLPFEDKQSLYEDMSDEEKKIYDPNGHFKKQLDQMKNTTK